MSMWQAKRRYPIGAELIGENETHFRVWAPKAQEVDVVLENAAGGKPQFCGLTTEPGGYFSGAASVSAGDAPASFASAAARMPIRPEPRPVTPPASGYTSQAGSSYG